MGTFAKIEPFLADVRAALGNPDFLANLERLVLRLPSPRPRLADARERSRKVGVGPAEETAQNLRRRRFPGHRPGRRRDRA